eukprot:200232-Chlamydomonas_euryale.AAC.2
MHRWTRRSNSQRVVWAGNLDESVTNEVRRRRGRASGSDAWVNPAIAYERVRVSWLKWDPKLSQLKWDMRG